MTSISEPALKLLIVDDDDVDRERIRRMLRHCDFNAEINEASSADESLSCIRDMHYDCILVDYRLGKSDGLALMNDIHHISAHKSAVIMVTGLGDEEIAAEALRTGASDYLTKNQLQSPRLISAILSAVHRVELDRKLHELAHFDALTGLASRPLLIDRLQQVIKRSSRSDRLAALAFIDLDNFKPVNDRYGHTAGDKVLIEVGRRLRSALRIEDTVARLGGDEFVLLLVDVGSAVECEVLLRRVLRDISQPVEIADGQQVKVSASIGITMVVDSEVDADTVLRRADQTMYQVKNTGRGRVLFFDPREERRQAVRRQLLQDVENALLRNEFCLYYQPKIEFATRRILGFEALIRWHHPERGLLRPARFEPALEHSCLGVSIGDWVVREALEQMSRWQDKGLSPSVSINVSAPHLQNPNFLSGLCAMLDEYSHLPHGSLEFEVLESVSLTDMRETVQVLGRCRELGVSIALDDFGTGYASLSYLKQLPLDVLKIDRSFVQGMQSSQDDRAIIESMVGLSRAFGYRLIAEGVETLEHQQQLVDLGCQFGQGYFIAKPMPAEDIEGWAKSWAVH